MLIRSISLLLLVAIIGLGCTTQQPQSDNVSTKESFKIGVIASLTGKGASRGESVNEALKLAEKKIIDQGLLKDYELELVVQDVALEKAKDAPAALRLLVEVEQVDAIIGPMGSNVAMAIAPLVDDFGVPIITFAASARDVTKDNEYLLRLWPTAKNYSDAITPQVKEFEYKRVAALSAVNDNTIDLLNLLKSEPDINLVIDEQVSSDLKDFRTQLIKIKDSNPDALFINLFSGQIGVAAKQARELGIDIPFFTNAVAGPTELEVGDEFLEDTWQPRFSGYISSAKQEFIDLLGQEPGHPDIAAAAHDALLIFATAIDEVGTDSQKIKEHIYSNQFEGIIGNVSFQDNGDANVPIDIKVFKDGEIVNLID